MHSTVLHISLFLERNFRATRDYVTKWHDQFSKKSEKRLTWWKNIVWKLWSYISLGWKLWMICIFLAHPFIKMTDSEFWQIPEIERRKKALWQLDNICNSWYLIFDFWMINPDRCNDIHGWMWKVHSRTKIVEKILCVKVDYYHMNISTKIFFLLECIQRQKFDCFHPAKSYGRPCM